MASDSENIRNVLNLMESLHSPTLLEGWVDNLKKKYNSHLGTKERKAFATRLEREWDTWLGQTRREGTVDDMDRFMTHRIGFTPEDVEAVWSQAGFTKDSDEDEAEQADQPGDKNAKPDSQPEAPKAKAEPEHDEEEGRPIPKDLNTKLSDYGVVGRPDDTTPVEDDNVHEENPKDYMVRGKLDHKKVFDRLRQLGPGARLKLGKNTYDLNKGKKNESITEDEAEEQSGGNQDLTPEDIKDIFDVSAAYINDHYLYNGPKNDQDAAVAQAHQMGLLNNKKGGSSSRRGSDDSNSSTSSSHDSKEFNYLLSNDLGVSRQKLDKITHYVDKYAKEGYSRMQETDLDVLARIGYAYVRSKSKD